MDIDPKRSYFACDGMGLIELSIPGEAVLDIAQSGSNDEAVAYWAPKIERPSSATPEVLADVLSEYGAWEDDELRDDDVNWERIVWSLAWDVREGAFESEES